MDKGLISWNLVHALGHTTSKGKARTFTTAAGMFSTNEYLHINGAMLPCISLNTQECSADFNYGIIMGQDTM